LPSEKLHRRHRLAGLIDAAQASRLMGEFLKYYEEDLDVMWFGYKWIAVNSREPVGE